MYTHITHQPGGMHNTSFGGGQRDVLRPLSCSHRCWDQSFARVKNCQSLGPSISIAYHPHGRYSVINGSTGTVWQSQPQNSIYQGRLHIHSGRSQSYMLQQSLERGFQVRQEVIEYITSHSSLEISSDHREHCLTLI